MRFCGTDPSTLAEMDLGTFEERRRALAYLDGAGGTVRFKTAPIEDIKGTMLIG